MANKYFISAQNATECRMQRVAYSNFKTGKQAKIRQKARQDKSKTGRRNGESKASYTYIQNFFLSLSLKQKLKTYLSVT